MRRLFEILIDFSTRLGYTEDNAKWHTLLSKLDNISIDTDGVIKVAPDERIAVSHRHFSHLLPVHPLRQIKYESDEEKRIIDSSIFAEEELGLYYWVGYSFPLMAEMYVVQRNGDKAYNYLDSFWNYFCLPNGFHINGDYKHRFGMCMDYRPFTLEGNFCAADAMQEMFLLDSDAKVTIAPAIPAKWESYSFKLRSRNGVVLTAVIENKKLVSVEMEAYKDCDFELCYLEDSIERVKLSRGETKTIVL